MVGNGRKTLFWSGNWLGHGPLKDIFAEFFNIVAYPEASLDEVWGGSSRMEYSV